MGIQSSFVVSWADGVDRRIYVTATKESWWGWPHFYFITAGTSTARAEVFQAQELGVLGGSLRHPQSLMNTPRCLRRYLLPMATALSEA